MSTTKTYKEKLQLLLNTKTQFKNDIINAGGTIDNSTPFSSYPAIYKTLKGGAPDGTAVEVTTEADMDALLVSSNVGKFYKYTGETTNKYTKDTYYIIQDSDNPIVQECGGGAVNVTIPRLKPVPNSGPAKNILLNTDLTEDKIYEIIKRLNYTEGEGGIKIYNIALVVVEDPENPSMMDLTIYDFSKMINKEKAFGIFMADGNLPLFVSYNLAAGMMNDASMSGWSTDESFKEVILMFSMLEEMVAQGELPPITFYSKNPINNLDVGLQNDLITDLINSGYEEEDNYVTLSGDYTGMEIKLIKNEKCDLTEYFKENKIITAVNISLQSKSVSPSLNDQDIYSDEGYAGLNSIKVLGIKPNMLGMDYKVKSNVGKNLPDEMYSDLDIFRSFEIPSDVETIGHGILRNCKSLEKLNIPFAGYDKDGTSAGIHHLFGAPMGIANLDYTKKEYLPPNLKEVVLTNTKRIYGKLFYGCANLEKITITTGIAYADLTAFEECPNLKEVHISDLTSWCNMTANGFFSYAVPTIYLNGELLPSTLNIPEGATRICDYAFRGQNTIKNVNIPEGVTAMYEGCFLSCSNLKHINLPESLKTLDYSALAGTAISSITIPSKIVKLNINTFINCNNLNTVVITNPDNVVIVDTTSFKNTPISNGTGIVYVPDALVDSYKADTKWQSILPNYSTQIKPKSEYIE